MDKEKLTIDDIFTAMTISRSILDKALITFIISSGLKNQIVGELKIKDLLDACESSFKEQTYINNIKTLLISSDSKLCPKPTDNPFNLETLLQMDPMKIMPCWNIPGKIAFNTPESTYYLFLYLKGRKNHEKIENNDYLFEIYGKNENEDNFGQLEPKYISKRFNIINDRLHEIKETPASFNVSNLTMYFKSTCEKHLQGSHRQDAFDLLIGKAKKNNYYLNNEGIKKCYCRLTPYLTINFALYHPNINQYIIDFDQKNFNPQHRVFSEFDINTILKLTYNNKMVGFQEFDPYDGINIAYNKAIHDNKLGYFYYHKNYIDDLFNYVKTKLFINHVLSDINIKITKAKLDLKVNEIINNFKGNGIFEISGVNGAEYKEILKESIKKDLYDKKSIIITSEYICDVFEEIIFKYANLF